MRLDPGRNSGLAKDPGYLVVRQGMMPEMMIAEVPEGNKGKAICPEPKIRSGMRGESDAGSEVGSRWQGRPTAIVVVIAPTDPRRPPNSIRRPAPADALMT